MKKTLFLLAAGLMVSIIIAGCGTEKPWEVLPPAGISLSIVSGPSGTIVNGSGVTFSWTSTGGEGEVTYRYKLGSGAWSEWTNVTTVTYPSVSGPTTYIFDIEAQDPAGQTAATSREFTVSGTSSTITFTMAPAANSFAAVGGKLAFSWDAADQGNYGEDLEFRYFANFMAGGPDTSAWDPTRTVTFVSIEAADPAKFVLWARTPGGNVTVDSVVFVVKNASILYVDDYEWLDLNGNRDMPKERDQKQFYHNALEGYAIADWDISLQGMPDSAYVLNFSTIVWASDSYLGDYSPTWWDSVGSVAGNGVPRYYMENEGHLLVTGARVLYAIYNNNPPLPGDFEYDWFGLNDTDGWDYWDDFTWAVGAGNYPTLPDSMKIDVGKNGDQVDYAEDIFGFRDSTVSLYVKGLDISGAEPNDYGVSIGHIYFPGGGAARSSMVNFDTYSMPLEGIRETFRIVLTQFGE